MSLTNLSKVTTSGIATGTSLLITNVNSSGVVTASTVQVGSATTIHTTGIDLGSGNITSHNINSTGIITSTSFVGPVTGDLTGNVSSSGANTLGSLSVTNDATVGGALTVTGDLTVNGTTTTIDTAVTAVDSLAIDGDASVGGSVGIGTDNPLNTLHVKGPTGGISARLTDAVNATILVSHPSAGKSKIADAGGNYGFEFDTASVNVLSGGSEKLRIKSDGKIGIGTDNPTVKLDIFHSTGGQSSFAQIGAASYGTLQLGVDATGCRIRAVDTSDPIYFYTGTSEKLRITSGGNIGIGTDNPSSKVTVAADSATSQLELKRTNANTTGAIGALNFTALDGHSVANIYAIGDGDDEGAHLAFRTTSAAGESSPYGSNTFERLRIDSGGKIASTYDGTPTVAQYGQLEVTKNGASGIDPNWSYLSFHRSGQVAWQQGLKDNHFVIAHTGGAARDTLDNERLRITTSGNVGIGSTLPGVKLDVQMPGSSSRQNLARFRHEGQTDLVIQGQWGSRDIGGANGTLLYNSVQTLALRSGSSGNAHVVLRNTGNVGVGTAEPGERLDVDGSIRLRAAGNYTTYATRLGARLDSTHCTTLESYLNSNTPFELIGSYADSGGANPRVVLAAGGQKVGIGTNDPKRNLSVFGSDPKILIRDSASTSAFGDSRLEFGNFSHYPTAFISHKWDGTNGSMSFHTRVVGDEYTRMVLNSGGELLLGGLTSNTLASDDLQIQGNGGPAIISGYKSDNNPTADQKMLTVRGYSQSGSTFTSIGEIDVRVDQGSNTQSGYHPGSIVMRVNGGIETGTHSGQPYSFAGVKDRERITFKSKRFYCLPEYTTSDLYNTFRQQWDYQHYVGYNQYSWYKYSTHASISSRGGSADIMVTWSTGHASGSGHGRYAVYWRDRHDNHQLEIATFYSYFENSINGTYYGWTSNPSVDVYQCSGTYNNAGFYLRVQGHINANNSTYNGNAIQQFTINSHTNRYGSDVEQFKFVGNSTPSDAGSQLTKYNLP